MPQLSEQSEMVPVNNAKPTLAGDVFHYLEANLAP